MDELNLFIDTIRNTLCPTIWQRFVLTLHLSHANCWKAFNLSGSCCQFCSYMLCNFYLIESYQNSTKLNPYWMLIIGTLILLYFIIWMRTVSERYCTFVHVLILSSPKIRTLAKHLAPAYGRFGGTPADFIIFKPDSNSKHTGNYGYQMSETWAETDYESVPTSNYTLTGKFKPSTDSSQPTFINYNVQGFINHAQCEFHKIKILL